jgi:hypothetical protein
LLKKKTNSLRGRKRIRQTKTLQRLGLHSVFLQQQHRKNEKMEKNKKKNEEEKEEGSGCIERGDG